MLNWYKQFVFWYLEKTSHIPTMKTISRWQLRMLRKNFWRGYAKMVLFGIISNLALYFALERLASWLADRGEQREIERIAAREAEVDAILAEKHRHEWLRSEEANNPLHTLP